MQSRLSHTLLASKLMVKDAIGESKIMIACVELNSEHLWGVEGRNAAIANRYIVNQQYKLTCIN